MDVTALYPNVPRREARIAAKHALERRSDCSVPTDTVLEMMDSVLENNNFSFKEKHYVQNEGTAIGSRLGMNYASTYLGEWESELLENCEIKPYVYHRYVDDICGLWTNSVQELENFHKKANSIHPNIKVDLRYSRERIEFLDVNISIKNNTITTDLFSKPTDKHLYLHYTSSHPDSTKRAIPYGLGVRAKRICSDPKDYQKRRVEICQHLKERGYNEQLVDSQLQRVDNAKREDLLTYKNHSNNIDRVPLVLTFSRALPNIRNILAKRQKTLQKSDRMKNIFAATPILAFRRDANLQDILVHKKHNKMFFNKPHKSEPCGKNCAICPYIVDTDKFTGHDGTQYNVRNYINCKSCNVVYAIFCKKCDRFIYVGETGDLLYQRQLLNLSLIRRRKEDPVAKHFYTNGHSVDDFSVVGLEKLYLDVNYRQTREKLWIQKLRTEKPYGANTKIN